MTYELILTTFRYFFAQTATDPGEFCLRGKIRSFSKAGLCNYFHDFNTALPTNNAVISQDPPSILCKNTTVFVYMFSRLWCMSCFIGSSEKGTFFSHDALLDSAPKVHQTAQDVLLSAL